MKQYLDVQGVRVHKDVFLTYFVCDYAKCKGACCWAPAEFPFGGKLTKSEEREILDKKSEIAPFVPGKFQRRYDKTPLLYSGEEVFTNTQKSSCLFSDSKGKTCIFKNTCGNGVTSFDIPESCGLYPLAVERRRGKDHLVVLTTWNSVCAPAFELGRKLGTPLFRFLGDKLIKKYGGSFYKELEIIYNKML